MNSIRIASVTKNTSVKDFSISDGASPGPAARSKVCSLTQVPWLTQFYIQADDFHSLSNSKLGQVELCGEIFFVFEILLATILGEMQMFISKPAAMSVVYKNTISQQ